MKAPIHYRYVYEDVDRHGNVRRYFWRGKGHPKVRITAETGTEAFSIEYHKLLAGHVPEKPAAKLRAGENTWRWLCERYMTSAAWRTLEGSTQAVRRNILERTWSEPVEPGSDVTFAAFPLDRLSTPALCVLRDRAAKGGPEAANGRVKAIRAVYKWACSREVALVYNNPARDMAKIRNATSGFHSWTDAEIAAFETRHPVGTRARLALDLMLYTGAARADAVRLGRPHLKAGVLTFRRHKTRNSTNQPVITIPVLPPLAASLDAAPTGELTFLATQAGRPFTAAGFGNWFRDRCNEAGLPQCSAHGLRKAAAARCAEAGATASELMAIFGWTSIVEAERYTKAAERVRMAARAMGGLVR
jgi:integrase